MDLQVGGMVEESAWTATNAGACTSWILNIFCLVLTCSNCIDVKVCPNRSPYIQMVADEKMPGSTILGVPSYTYRIMGP